MRKLTRHGNSPPSPSFPSVCSQTKDHFTSSQWSSGESRQGRICPLPQPLQGWSSHSPLAGLSFPNSHSSSQMPAHKSNHLLLQYCGRLCYQEPLWWSQEEMQIWTAVSFCPFWQVASPNWTADSSCRTGIWYIKADKTTAWLSPKHQSSVDTLLQSIHYKYIKSGNAAQQKAGLLRLWLLLLLRYSAVPWWSHQPLDVRLVPPKSSWKSCQGNKHFCTQTNYSWNWDQSICLKILSIEVKKIKLNCWQFTEVNSLQCFSIQGFPPLSLNPAQGHIHPRHQPNHPTLNNMMALQ